MLAFLIVRRDVPAKLESTSRGLLSYLSLLFVPAGVGVVRYLDLLAHYWVPIAASIVGSTALTMIVTWAVMHALSRRRRAA
jgi:holin-like protein